MDSTMRLIGKRFRALRKRLKYTQEEVAEKAGINPTYYGRVERGEANISLELLILVAEALGVSLPDLLNVASEKNREQVLKELTTLLNSASDEQIKIIYRFAKDLLV